MIIVPYLGWGTPQHLALEGRVLDDALVPPAQERDSRWRNLLRFWRRLESDEVPGARVKARFQGIETEATADGEGYFRVEISPGEIDETQTWHEVELELVHPRRGVREAVRTTGRVMVPSRQARFGVISDIDDTVVPSGATRKVSMVVRLALSSARTRKPFAGVAAFYRALHAGVNPFFYLSKSPWNLYDPLVHLFDLQGLPQAPLLLRDYGLQFLRRDGTGHKATHIARVLDTYPALPFVLIGDSGEQDPEIYSEAVRTHPERIKVIYIRSVTHGETRDPSRIAAVQKLIEEVRPTGCQLVLVPDTGFAAAHAAGEGLLQPS
ncbi:MAG: App1 family protein, partial [Betaproteobacteria bacterium]